MNNFELLVHLARERKAEREARRLARCTAMAEALVADALSEGDYYASFRSSDLRDRDLRDEELCRVDFRCTNLSGADLRGAKMWDSDLRGALLDGTKLAGADLWGVHGNGREIRSMTIGGKHCVWITSPEGVVSLWAGCVVRTARQWDKMSERACRRLRGNPDDNVQWMIAYRDTLRELVAACPAVPHG